MKVLQRPSRPRDVGIRSSKPSRSLSATSQTRDSLSGPEHSPTSLGIQLYKTELCRSFAESGYCRYGLKCRFAHGQPDLRPVMRHKRYKTEKCKNFARSGQCPYGLRCRFIHDTKEQDNLALSSALCTPTLNPTSTPLSPAEAWARAPSDTCAVDFTLDTNTSVSDDDADIEQYLHENSLVLSDLLDTNADESSVLVAPLHNQSYNPDLTLPFSPIFSPSFSPPLPGQAHGSAFAEFSLELSHNLGRTSTFKSLEFSNVGFVEKPTIFGIITQTCAPPEYRNLDVLGPVPGDLDEDLSVLSLFPRMQGRFHR